MSTQAAHAKLATARTRLILERPFLGTLVVHLPVIASERVRTIATDTRAIYFNAGFIGTLDLAETQFMLAHEALHCALLHHTRRGTRLAARWDRACDYAVNQLLVDDGLRAPMGSLLSAGYRGLTAEAIYPLLADEGVGEPIDEHWFGASAEGLRIATSRPHEVTNDADAHRDAHQDGLDEITSRGDTAHMEDAATPNDWQHRLVAAALETAAAGRLSGHWRAILTELAQPSLPWRSLLARFLMTLAREDFTFARPNRREGDAILPGLASHRIELTIAIDTSGSISPADLQTFTTELDALKGQIRASVTLLACDAEIAAGSPWRFEPWESLALPAELGGGGSTRFTPVFEWIEADGRRPDALVYFTDAQGEFPLSEPPYPVLWLVQGNGPVPWGERVQLNA